MLGLHGQNAGSGLDDERRGEQVGGAAVGRDADVLEDARESEVFVLVVEADAKGVEVDIRLCDGERAEEGSKENYVSSLINAYLMGDGGREDQVIGEGDLRTTCGEATSRRIAATRDAVGGEASLLDAVAVLSVGVELGFEILEVQSEVEDRNLGGGGA